MEKFPIACLIQTSGLLLEILLLDQIIAISAKHAARMRIEPYDLMFFRIISCNRNQREQHYTLPHTVCVLARIIMTKSAKLEKLANHVKVYKSLNDKSEKTFKSSNCSRFRYIFVGPKIFAQFASQQVYVVDGGGSGGEELTVKRQDNNACFLQVP